jgi:hypothetical protein
MFWIKIMDIGCLQMPWSLSNWFSKTFMKSFYVILVLTTWLKWFLKIMSCTNSWIDEMENIGGSCDLHMLHAFDREKIITCLI